MVLRLKTLREAAQDISPIGKPSKDKSSFQDFPNVMAKIFLSEFVLTCPKLCDPIPDVLHNFSLL